MTAAPQSIQPKGESLPERLRVGSCRYANETQDDAAMRRIKTDLEAAARIEELEAALQNIMGAYDTPVSRRRFPPDDFMREALSTARAAIEPEKPL